ncbi:MAG: FixH family protein [Rhodobacteraceae bacterium]|nr:FixH family protein [Paracoccaceae bacterium]
MVLAITVSAFSVIIGVNVLMAWFAVETFPGLEVQNTYVASQGFNQRLHDQQALGWRSEADLTGGRLTVRVLGRDGNPAPVADISAILGRPTTEREDTVPDLRFEGGAFVADVDVDYGNWDLRIDAHAADGTEYTYRVGLIHHR